MKKNNAALTFYIQSWQKLIGAMPLADQATNWHSSTTPVHANIPITTSLAYQDLAHALHQYEIWQSRPRYQFSAPTIWQGQSARLLELSKEGTPLLLIPSMINGKEILNLPGKYSLANFLKNQGFAPYLLEWSPISAQNSRANIQTLQEDLQSASAFLRAPALLGYCLGGTLAHLTPLPEIQRQVLIGVPWKFQHDQGRVGQFASYLAQTPISALEQSLHQIDLQFGLIPALFVDHLFADLNPLQFIQKFRKRDQRADLELFDALEDWLNGEINLPLPMTKEMLIHWFRDDTLHNSTHQSNRHTLAIFGARDHIAPPKSCQAIAQTGKNIQITEFSSGHVGLIVGNQSRRVIWPKIGDFLKFDFK